MSTDAMPSSATLARPDVVTGNDSELLRSLLEASLRSLPQMYRPDVREFAQTVRPDPVRPGELRQEGVNERYAAIVGLGAARLDDDQQRTLLAGITADDLVDSVAVRAARNADLGAVALAAWASAEVCRSAPPALVDRLAHAVRAARMQDTVSYAWTLTALLATAGLADVSGLAEQSAERLLAAQEASGLFPHALPKETLGRFRSHVACFADQVYPIQALARYWRATGDRRALAAANRCAAVDLRLPGLRRSVVVALRRARPAGVVEGYPVYSVHQHAMAPDGAVRPAGGGRGRPPRRRPCAGLRWLQARPETATPSWLDGATGVDLAQGGPARAPQGRPVRPRPRQRACRHVPGSGCSTAPARRGRGPRMPPVRARLAALRLAVGRHRRDRRRVAAQPGRTRDDRPVPTDSRVLFGLPITACSMDDVVALGAEAVRSRRRMLVGVVNAAKIVKLRRDELLRTSLLDCE